MKDLKIFTNNIEDSAKAQIDLLLEQDAFKDCKIRIMPDVHAGAGCVIGVGKGNEDWNYSAPHGAGRVMSRNMARQTLNMEDYKKSMNGIYTTSVNEETIDEAPMVYKPMEEIIKYIEPTIEIEKIIKPIYNFKASE